MISSLPNNSFFPKYYNTILLNHSLWFKITQLKEFDYNTLVKNFVTKSTNANLENVFCSMCSSFYITYTNNINIKTGK